MGDNNRDRVSGGLSISRLRGRLRLGCYCDRLAIIALASCVFGQQFLWDGPADELPAKPEVEALTDGEETNEEQDEEEGDVSRSILH